MVNRKARNSIEENATKYLQEGKTTFRIQGSGFNNSFFSTLHRRKTVA